MGEAYEPMGYGPNVGDTYQMDDGSGSVYQVVQTPSGPVRIDYGTAGGGELNSSSGSMSPQTYYQNVQIPLADGSLGAAEWRPVTQQEAWSPTFAPVARTYEQIAPSIRSSFGPSPAQVQADANAAKLAQLAQFAGGMLNRGPIGVPQVSAFTNYAPMPALPNAAAQPFAFINPGSGAGLLGGATSNAQPFGAPMSGGLFGGGQ